MGTALLEDEGQLVRRSRRATRRRSWRSSLPSLPFSVTATAIGAELGLIGGAESAELIAAALLSVLFFPLAGSVLLREATTERSERPCPA